MSSRIRCSPSGLLWRLGVPLEVAYWIWKPVAVATLFAGALALAARLLPGERLAQAAAVALALFSFTPIAALVGWAELGSAAGQEHVVSTTWELFGAGSLWGYMPTAIAIGSCRRWCWRSSGRSTRGGRPPGGARKRGVGRRGRVVMSWLHPWQGVIMLLVLAGLAAWPGGRARAGARSSSFPRPA